MTDEKIELLKHWLSSTEPGTKETLERSLGLLVNHTKEVTVQRPEQLRQFYNLLNQRYVFKKGQLVRWKMGLRNRAKPEEGEPAIVISILDAAVYDESAQASQTQFLEPLDLVLGVIADDGTFWTYHFNSQRFEPYNER